MRARSLGVMLNPRVAVNKLERTAGVKLAAAPWAKAAAAFHKHRAVNLEGKSIAHAKARELYWIHGSGFHR